MEGSTVKGALLKNPLAWNRTIFNTQRIKNEGTGSKLSQLHPKYAKTVRTHSFLYHITVKIHDKTSLKRQHARWF